MKSRVEYTAEFPNQGGFGLDSHGGYDYHLVSPLDLKLVSMPLRDKIVAARNLADSIRRTGIRQS